MLSSPHWCTKYKVSCLTVFSQTNAEKVNIKAHVPCRDKSQSSANRSSVIELPTIGGGGKMGQSMGSRRVGGSCLLKPNINYYTACSV